MSFDATLKGDDRVLPLFRDYRTAGEWLPKTLYVSRFMASGKRSIAAAAEGL